MAIREKAVVYHQGPIEYLPPEYIGGPRRKVRAVYTKVPTQSKATSEIVEKIDRMKPMEGESSAKTRRVELEYSHSDLTGFIDEKRKLGRDITWLKRTFEIMDNILHGTMSRTG